MNTFAIISLLVAVSCFILAIYVFRFSRTQTHRIWAFFNLAVSFWSLNLFFVATSDSAYYAEIFWRGANGVGSFVVITFYHFIHSFCGLKKKRALFAGYALSLFLSLLAFFSPNFINHLNYVFGSFYYSKATTLFDFYMLYVALYVYLSFSAVLKYLKVVKDHKRIQSLYVLGGFGLGWAGGISTFLPHYGILVYPLWHFSIFIYTFILTFALLRNNFLEIRVSLKSLLIPVTIAIYSKVVD